MVARHAQESPEPPCSPVPAAFRLPCPACGQEVVFPFDAVLSARLDWLLVWEETDRRIEALKQDTTS